MRVRTTPKLARRAMECNRLDMAFCPANYDFAKTFWMYIYPWIYKGKLHIVFYPDKSEYKRRINRIKKRVK